MNQQARPADVTRALKALTQYLQYLKDEGVRQVDVDPARLAALKAAARTQPPVARPAVSARPPERAPERGPQLMPVAKAPVSVPAKPAPATGPVADGLSAIAREVAACQKCRLCKTRTNVVPGQGATAPDIMFIGEGPGADEDLQGLAFVGRAGQLLTKIIEAMGYTRDQVFIGNVVKCRPPDNRTPLPDEMAECLPYLKAQIALLKPRIIVALGGTAMKGLFNDPKIAITRIRGQWMTYEGIDVMPTFHPAFLLRNPPSKREVWEDMKMVLKRLGKEPPRKGA
jgi:uracil-DNA glycosylase family 4